MTGREDRASRAFLMALFASLEADNRDVKGGNFAFHMFETLDEPRGPLLIS